MSEFNDGGPAFPSENDRVYFHGMTLRDYFAAKALTQMPIMWDGKYSDDDHRRGHPRQEAEWCATAAYRYADAMLAERAK